jgi:excisionase family DNA binding protein
MPDAGPRDPGRTALYVRIPSAQAREIDQLVAETGLTKQRVVASMLAHGLEHRADGLTPYASAGPKQDDILTLEELASLLRLDAKTVLARAADGELPGRRFGDDWRFSGAAVLAWLAEPEENQRRSAGFGPERRS